MIIICLYARVLVAGLFLPQLEHWLAYVPRESILVLTTDEFFGDTAATMARVAQHLGLDPIDWAPIVASKYNVRRTPVQQNVDVAAVGERIRDSVDGRSQPRPGNVGMQAEEAKRSSDAGLIPVSVKAKLQRLYEPFNALLADWLGRPGLWVAQQ